MVSSPADERREHLRPTSNRARTNSALLYSLVKEQVLTCTYKCAQTSKGISEYWVLGTGLPSKGMRSNCSESTHDVLQEMEQEITKRWKRNLGVDVKNCSCTVPPLALGTHISVALCSSYSVWLCFRPSNVAIVWCFTQTLGFDLTCTCPRRKLPHQVQAHARTHTFTFIYSPT